MTSIFYYEPELVIALGNRVIFVNPNDLQIFKEIVLPTCLTKLELKNGNVNNEEEQNDESIEKQSSPIETPAIQHVKMSPNRQLLAVTTSGQKCLLLYTLRPEQATLVSTRSLARASSALSFSTDSTRLLVTDKTGDCYEYDCVQYEAAPKLLFGHLSIVYDVLWSSDEKFVVTCDRDGKIRVTNYPATYDIHSYCLGHKEFVSGIEFLNDNVLLSLSGDGTIKLWDFKQGKEIMNINIPAPGIKFSVKHLTKEEFEIAVLLHQENEGVAVYLLTHDEEKQWKFGAPQMFTLNDITCGNLCFANQRLYITGEQNNHFALKLTENSPVAPANWIEMVEEQFRNCTWVPEDVSEWFKKKYDNVSEYMERKKRRIEEKLK